MSNDDKNPLAVGFGAASADDPPFPAQQHLDVTDDLGGQGIDTDDAVDADDYDHLEGVPAEGENVDPTGADNLDDDDDDDDDDADADEKPEHDDTVAAIEAWVEAHPEDAQEYLDAEQAKSKPRSSLVESLEATVAAE